MRFSVVLREAWRDVAAGVSHTASIALLLAALLAGCVALELGVVAGITQRAQEFRDAGGSTILLQAPGHIDGASCEALTGVEGVLASGALRAAASDLVPAELPAGRVAAFEVTESFPELLGSTEEVGGVHLSQQVADALGAVSGASVAFVDHPAVMVGGVFVWDETDGRRAGFGYSALIPTASSGVFDECWLEAWPMKAETRQLLMMTVLGADQREGPTMTQLNPSKGSAFEGAHELRSRPTRWLPVALGAVVLALGFATTRRRRLELASDLHLGVRVWDLRTKHLVEAVLASASGVALAMPSMVLMAARFEAADRSYALTSAAAMASTLAGTFILGTQLALATVRERHLYRYFQLR